MSRVVPNRTASDSRAVPSTRSSSASVDPVRARDVVDGGQRLGRDRVADRRPQDLGVALTRRPAIARGQEGPPKDGRRRAFGGGEVDVARRHGQAVGLADRRAGDDRRGDRQVARHLADDHDLLGVLLAEVRMLGADQSEQDRHDRGDAIEVTGPGRALERLRDGPDRDGRIEAGRVDLLDAGCEDQVHALRLADRQVAGLVARVLVEVRPDVELARIHEDRDDGRGIRGAGLGDQRAVAVMEPAHGRHETDGAFGGGEGVAKLGAGPEDAGQGRWARR